MRQERSIGIPRTLLVAPHLSLEDLCQREHTVPAADRVRVLTVRLVAEGRPATEVGPLVGFSPEWVRTLVHRYNAEGISALSDGRRNPVANHCWMRRSRPRYGRRSAVRRRMGASGPAASPDYS